jgi:integrase
LPKTPPQRREIFRYDEWALIVQHVDPWHQPMLEFMMITGMIHSEIAGLQRADIRSDHIMVQKSIVRGVESATLKTPYRIRKLPLTRRIQNLLETVLSRTDSLYVFARPDGSPYRFDKRVDRLWKQAIEAAGAAYRPFYSIRHSFAAWSLAVGIDPNRLVRLMGHGRKQMVYEIYGNYVDGLESDFWDIMDYFGRDFVEVKRKAPMNCIGNNPGTMMETKKCPPSTLVKVW